MKDFIRITCEFYNGNVMNMEGLKDSIWYEPENNELSFKCAGNSRIKFNTFYMKKIVINGEMVKGNVDCYC